MNKKYSLYKLLEPEEVEDWYKEFKLNAAYGIVTEVVESTRYQQVLESYLRLCELHEE